jgi:four helix bundle protein
MHAYRQLKAWQLAQVVGELLTTALTHRAQYRTPGLRTQLVRAGLSISANIAEGSSRRSPAEFRRYLEISLGSLLEVENGLTFAARCSVIQRAQYWTLKAKCNLLRRMLQALIGRLDNN